MQILFQSFKFLLHILQRYNIDYNQIFMEKFFNKGSIGFLYNATQQCRLK